MSRAEENMSNIENKNSIFQQNDWQMAGLITVILMGEYRFIKHAGIINDGSVGMLEHRMIG